MQYEPRAGPRYIIESLVVGSNHHPGKIVFIRSDDKIADGYEPSIYSDKAKPILLNTNIVYAQWIFQALVQDILQPIETPLASSGGDVREPPNRDSAGNGETARPYTADASGAGDRSTFPANSVSLPQPSLLLGE